MVVAVVTHIVVIAGAVFVIFATSPMAGNNEFTEKKT